MAEYITDKIEYGGNVYKLKEAVMHSKTFTGLIGSENNTANATFYFGKIVPTGYYDQWQIKYRVTAIAAGDNRAKASYEIFLMGSESALNAYYCYNSIQNGSYRPTYYHALYRATSTGMATYGHIIGEDMESSWNRTTSANSRTFTIEILDTQNCTFTFFDSALKYASVPGTGSTNYSGISLMNGADNGLQETGDANTIDQNRICYTYQTTKTVLYRYQICFTMRDNARHLLPTNVVNNGYNNTSKALTTEAFDPFGEIYYYNSTTTVNADANLGNQLLYRQVLADVRYSFNIAATSASHLTAYQPLYVVATPQADGTAKLASTPLSQTLPTSEDGLIYIYLGQVYRDTYPYRCELRFGHPVYWYKNGAVELYVPPLNVATTNVIGGVKIPASSIISNTSGAIDVKYGTGLDVDNNNNLVIASTVALKTDIKTYTGEKGITVSSANKVGHSNTAIDAVTTQGMYKISFDAYGHIDGYTAVTLPTASTTVTDIATTSSAGSGTTYSRGNHKHKIALATGDAAGQVKIAGSNVTVKGWADHEQRITALEEQICLIEGTKIKMADGSEKNIEDVQTGDMVLSYNPAKAEQIPAMALKSVRTGVAKDFDVLVYENGNYAEMYQEHSIYDTALGYPHSHKEWNVGDEGLMVDGPSKLIRKTTSRHAIIKERFVLVTSTGLYYANGILMGIWPSTKYNITKHSCYGLNLPDDILNEFKREGELNDRSNTLEINPDFLKRSKTLQTTIYNLSKEIEDCKKNLLDTDYIVTKFTEGLISAAEWLKSKASRANWRSLINKDEGPLAEAMEQLEALKQQIKGDNPSLKDIYWESVTKANEMLPAFQEWFENWQKPEE